MRRYIPALLALLAGLAVMAPSCATSSSGGSSSPAGSYTGWNPVPVADGGGVAIRTGTAAGTHAPEWLLAAAAGAAAGGIAGSRLGHPGTLYKTVESAMTGDPCKDGDRTRPGHYRVASWYVSRLRHGRQGRPFLDCRALGGFKSSLGSRPTAQQVIACISAILRHGLTTDQFGELLWQKEDAWVVVTEEGRIATATPGAQGWANCAAKA